MKSKPKIVDTVSPKETPKISLLKRLQKWYLEYLFMRLDEQLVLALVHAGYEPITGKTQIFFKYKGPPHKFRMRINQIKIRRISSKLVKLEGVK